MTTTSGVDPRTVELAQAHGADLHRLAVMLTADPADATALVARTLAGRTHGDEAAGGGPLDALTKDLVRHYLRSAPRRADRVLPAGEDAGDVLRALRPRARAAAVLRFAAGWDPARTADAVRVSRRRVGSLLPQVSGLDLALAGLADQHALGGADLRTALDDALTKQSGAAPASSRLRWAWVPAAVLPLVLVIGYAVGDRADGDDQGGEGGPADGGETVPGPATFATDLAAAGWRLDGDGGPPRVVMGLRLSESVTLERGRRSAVVDLPADATSSYMSTGVAGFGVLWCDMPPTQDAHLQVPSGTLRVDGVEIELPCAGRDGSPPISQVVPLPLGGEGVLEIEGDMPGDGQAVLAVYTETDPTSVPAPLGSRSDAPPVPGDAVVLDLSGSVPSLFGGQRHVEVLTVGPESSVRVWAGRTGSVAVTVDGVAATDDGDVAAVQAMLEDLTPAQLEGDEPILSDPRDYTDWSTQQPDLREGRWLVPAPGEMRTFALPEGVRPPPGERRTVAVEVVTEHVDEHLQVVVSSAGRVDVEPAPVPARTEPEAPELILGHRLVGEWELPSDGVLRELRTHGSDELAEGTVLMIARDAGPRSWFSWGEGVATRGEQTHPLWLEGGMDTVVRGLRSSWHEPLPDGPGPVRAAAPPAPGHPPATVVAYVPVPYEEFDFSAAAPPPDARAVGSPPPDDSLYEDFTGWHVQAVIGPEDLEDGRLTLPVVHGNGLAARVTTEGRGRIRFVIEGDAAEAHWATDGWWSSWTDEAVVTETHLGYAGTYTRPEIEVTVVVEDYEQFTVELLTD